MDGYLHNHSYATCDPAMLIWTDNTATKALNSIITGDGVGLGLGLDMLKIPSFPPMPSLGFNDRNASHSTTNSCNNNRNSNSLSQPRRKIWSFPKARGRLRNGGAMMEGLHRASTSSTPYADASSKNHTYSSNSNNRDNSKKTNNSNGSEKHKPVYGDQGFDDYDDSDDYDYQWQRDLAMLDLDYLL